MAFPEDLIKPIIKLLEIESSQKYQKEHSHEQIHIIQNIPYIEDQSEYHLLDILYPNSFKGNLPIILNIHGGGFSMNSKDDIYQIYAMRLANEGYAIVNINYRLSTDAKFPAQIEDVFSVLHFLEKHHQEYNLDLNQCYLVGDSAGAYLAAMTECILTNSTLADYYQLHSNIHVKALGLNCGLYDFQTTMSRKIHFPMKKQMIELLFGTFQYKKLPIFPYSSVTNYITDKFCPTYLIDTDYFSFSNEAILLKKQLDEHQVLNSFTIYPKDEKLPHVFHLMDRYMESTLERKKMITFFQQVK